MPVDRDKHDKQAVLRQHAALNPRPHGVTHALFASNEFFDPDDVLQVKYEMLRLVNIDKRSIARRQFGCTVRGSAPTSAWPIRRTTARLGFVHPSRYVRMDAGVESVCGADAGARAATG